MTPSMQYRSGKIWREMEWSEFLCVELRRKAGCGASIYPLRGVVRLSVHTSDPWRTVSAILSVRALW